MPVPRRIRQGDVLWLRDCPPLEGRLEKTRPVVVVSPTEAIRDSSRLAIVVCASGSVLESEPDRILLPNLEDDPRSTSGLPRRCWAIPRWFFAIEQARLTERAGHIGGSTLAKVVAAVVARVREQSKH